VRGKKGKKKEIVERRKGGDRLKIENKLEINSRSRRVRKRVR
jgi:hypothetical protein